MVISGDITTVRLSITGRVQGVWYRGWTVDQAKALGLAGWVRNFTDGSVEALVNGPKDKVDILIAECHHGPALARVDNIDVNVVDPPGEGGAFPTREFEQLQTFEPCKLQKNL